MSERGSSISSGDTTGAIRATARAFERDRYLAALLSPPAARDDLLAIAALAGELARIPAFVSEPTIGEIRLQWWRDAVDGDIATAPAATGHPIGDAVLRAIRRHRLPTALLHATIDAQSSCLDQQPFPDLDAALEHHAAWHGGLFEIAWRIIGGRGEPPAELAEAGEVYGLARSLIEAPAELAQGRSTLPADLLRAHGVSLETMRSHDRMQAWRAISAELSGIAGRRLAQVVTALARADRTVRLATLPIALVRPYLAVSQQSDISDLQAHDVWPLTRVWRLWRACRRGVS